MNIEGSQLKTQVMISTWKRIFCLLLTIVVENRGDNKVWIQTTRLDDLKSWNSGQLPCSGQAIVLPDQVMYVPSDFKFGPEIILPKENGLLIFASDGENFLLEENEERSCHKVKQMDKAAHFKGQAYGNWYDPQNWRSEFYQNGILSPIPHLHRVPCRYDQAIFPQNAAYKVSIDERHPPVELSQMTINNIEMNSVQFRSLYSGGAGFSRDISQMIFQVNQTVNIFQDACPHSLEGCTCHTDALAKETICSFQQCPPQPLCSSAIQPKDHCCYDICGAIVHVQKPEYVDVPFNMDEVEDQMKTLGKPLSSPSSKWGMMPKSHEFENVRFHISRITQKEYQIVITDVKGHHSTSQKFAQKIYDKLMTDYYDYGFYIWLEFSGVGPPSAWKRTGNVFGILFLLGLIGALVYLSSRTYKKEIVKASSQMLSSVTSTVQSMRGSGSIVETLTPMASAPHYNAFENEESPSSPENENQTGISYNDLKSRDPEEDTKGFANPMYDEPKRNRLENLYSPPPEKEGSGEKTYQNPLFDVMVDITNEAKKDESEKTSSIAEELENSKERQESIGKDDAAEDENIKQFLEHNLVALEATIQEEPTDANLAQSVEEVEFMPEQNSDETQPEKSDSAEEKENPLLVEF